MRAAPSVLKVEVLESGVREAVAEGKERLLMLRFKPTIADSDSFRISKFEGTVLIVTHVFNRPIVRSHADDAWQRKIGIGSGKSGRQFARWIDYAEQEISDRFATPDTRIPGSENTANHVNPRHRDWPPVSSTTTV